MDTFEDENPFESEDQVLSETSSTSRVDISEPNSPSAKIARALSQSPPINKSFPLQRQATTPTAADKTDFCCSRDRWLHSGDEFEIRVSHYSACLHWGHNAVNIFTDHRCAKDVCQRKFSLYHVYNQGRSKLLDMVQKYIRWLHLAQNASAHHRYSEFESLRSNLVKLYPTVIIPPIPSKNTVSDYAIKQTKAKEDAALIARRKRMLQTFLNRVARHPVLSNEHVFHRFLDGEVSWVRLIPLVDTILFIYNTNPRPKSSTLHPSLSSRRTSSKLLLTTRQTRMLHQPMFTSPIRLLLTHFGTQTNAS